MSSVLTVVYGALLVAGLFGISLCLGGATLVAFCSLTGASWWTPIRRVPMAVALLLPVPLLVIAVALFAGTTTLFSWADPQHVAASSILQAKSAWLNAPFFLARAVVVMASWLIIVGALRRALVGTIDNPGAVAAGRLKRASAVFIVVLAPTLSVAAWDWAMSLEPEWFSTMYGVYLFSGAVLGGLAVVSAILTMPGADRVFGQLVDRDVLHDLGQLLFGFSAFWAYIWFCQYMLIWYANLPEEATYFALRFDMRWATLGGDVPGICGGVDRPLVGQLPHGVAAAGRARGHTLGSARGQRRHVGGDEIRLVSSSGGDAERRSDGEPGLFPAGVGSRGRRPLTWIPGPVSVGFDSDTFAGAEPRRRPRRGDTG